MLHKSKDVIKSCALILLLLIFGGTLDYFIRYKLITPQYLRLEQQKLRSDVVRVVQAINREQFHLGIIGRDWAQWEGMARYLRFRMHHFQEKNLGPANLKRSGIEYLSIFDNRGEAVSQVQRNHTDQDPLPLDLLPPAPLANDHFFRIAAIQGKQHTGYIPTRDGILLLATSPIPDPRKETTHLGLLLVGRLLDLEMLERLRTQTRVHFNFIPLSQVDITVNSIQPAQMPPGVIELVPSLRDEVMDGYVLTTDIQGQPGALLHAQMIRDIYLQGRASARFVSVTIALFTTVLIGLISFIFLGSQRKAEKRRIEIEKVVKKRTAEAQYATERMRILAEAPFEGIVLLEDGKCLLMNKRIEEMYGYTPNELLGEESTILVHPDDREEARQKIAIQYNSPYRVTGLKKDGTIFPLEISGKSLDFQGRSVRAVAMRDLTEQLQQELERTTLEEQLRRSQKMETIGMIAGGVAHDLNNILSGLVTYPELLMLKLDKDDPLYEQLDKIQRAGRRAADVVADLLTVARGVAMETRPENLNLIVREYLESPEHQKLQHNHPEVSYLSELADILPNCLGSRSHIMKSLMNLVANGSEAINGQGTVRITTTSTSLSSSEAHRLNITAGEYVSLIVRDSGTGISDDDLTHIFEPFYTRKVAGRSGTGLGLTVVWNTMQNHNGAIEVSSDENGSYFTLHFPTTDQQTGEKSLVGIEKLYGQGEQILMVDDDPDQRLIGSRILKTLHYTAFTAESGEQALEFLLENSVDLVILDMLMEPGLNGYETYARILQLKPEQKALIASGYSEIGNVEKAIELGAGQYIRKPYSISQIGQAIKKVLDSSFQGNHQGEPE